MKYLSDDEKTRARLDLQENGKAARDARHPHSRGVNPRISLIRDDQEQAEDTPEPEF